MELSKDELQYLLNAINTHVRANGLTVAVMAVVLSQKIQAEAKLLSSDPPQDKD